jgi:hypothetical protein
MREASKCYELLEVKIESGAQDVTYQVVALIGYKLSVCLILIAYRLLTKQA